MCPYAEVMQSDEKHGWTISDEWPSSSLTSLELAYQNISPKKTFSRFNNSCRENGKGYSMIIVSAITVMI